MRSRDSMEQEDEFQTHILTLHESNEHRAQQLCSVNRSILLTSDLMRVYTIGFVTKSNTCIAVKSSSYFTVFWFSVYITRNLEVCSTSSLTPVLSISRSKKLYRSFLKLLFTFYPFNSSFNGSVREKYYSEQQFPKRQLPKSVLVAVLASQACSSRCGWPPSPSQLQRSAPPIWSLRRLREPNITFGKLQLRKMHIWKLPLVKLSL